MGAIVLGMRLGFLEKLHKDTVKDLKAIKEEEFAKSIHDTFLESVNLGMVPAKLAKYLKPRSWRKFCSAVSLSLNQGKVF